MNNDDSSDGGSYDYGDDVNDDDMCLQYKDDDGCTFPPIVELIKMLRREGCKFDEPPPVKPTSKKKPPHALLPEDEEDEVPVHDDNEK